MNEVIFYLLVFVGWGLTLAIPAAFFEKSL
jgi:hypothetical protein